MQSDDAASPQPAELAPQPAQPASTATSTAALACNTTPNPAPPKPPPPRRGRPPSTKPKAPKPPPYDATQPLENARHEKLASLAASGMSQTKAYIATSKTRVSHDSARANASKVFALPDVRARFNWLAMEYEKGQKQPQNDNLDTKALTSAKNASEKMPAAIAASIISRDEIAAKLSDAIRNGNTAEVVSSAAALLKVMPSLADEEKRSADPAAVIATIASFAGMTGEQILRELGGPRFVAEKMLATLKLTAIEARDLFQSIVDQREANPSS